MARGTPPRPGWPFRGDLLRHHDAVRRQLHRRSLRPDVEAVDPDGRGRSADHVTRLLARARRGEVRVRGARAARHHRHDDDDLGQRPHRPLCRVGAAEPRAVRDRYLPSRLPALGRGRAQILRPRRAVLGHAALRRVARLRLHRLDRVRHHRRGGAAIGRQSRARRRPRLLDGGLRLQNLRRAVPYVDARRL